MNSKTSTDTIAALATPPGRGGVGIIRVSGPQSASIADAILGHIPKPRYAEYLDFKDHQGQVLDSGIALYFPNPHSFTGEDVLELQGHGGPVVMDLLLAEVIHRGARLAKAGEFSERAFFNDKLDLAQAEAIADLIEAGSAQAARSAMQSLQGVFSDWVHTTVESLTELRMYVEAAIDFPEEEIDFLADEHITQRIKSLLTEFEQVLEKAQQGQLLKEGMRIVLAGVPNTGKSSLLNALAEKDSAIVTDIAGTTRDVLKEEISLDGLPLHIIDTAGLRESDDTVEKIGIDRSWNEIKQADQILLLIDAQKGFTEQEQAILDMLPETIPVTRVYNKIDLVNKQPDLKESVGENKGGYELYVSAKQGLGMELLKTHLKNIVGYHSTSEGVFMARRRHVDALQRAKQHVESGWQFLKEQAAGEILAEELRQSQIALSEITGEFSSDDLLGKIFSSFCIGK